MKLLLDTHVLLWFMQEPELLPETVVAAIEDSGMNSVVSMATLWEIAIKVSLGKLILPGEYEILFPASIYEAGLSLLPIEPHHLAALRRLEFHHRDPFDRLLIAQAKTEGLAVVTRDPFFELYGVSIFW